MHATEIDPFACPISFERTERPPRQGSWRRLSAQPRMRKDALDHRRLFNHRDDIQFAAARLAALNIDVEKTTG